MEFESENVWFICNTLNHKATFPNGKHSTVYFQFGNLGNMFKKPPIEMHWQMPDLFTCES